MVSGVLPLSTNAYTLLGLTGLVAALVAIVMFAFMRFITASRQLRSQSHLGVENALLANALQDAVARLKAQERATAARAEASERLSEEIIASLTAGLLVVGLQGEVRIINPAGRKLLGVAEDAAMNDYRQLVGEATLTALISECLSTGQPILRRTIQMAATGSNASRFGVTVSPLYDGAQALHGAVCLFTDLTAVQQLEEQLRLKESLATVGELTAGIAHEFRNGLATIHGYGKLIDPAQLPPAYHPYVEGIRAETESLGQIVTNFLNFARPAQLTLGDVDLQAVCERVAEEVRADARAAGGDIAVTGSFGRLQGDEVLLRQAFSNLLRNAVEACAGASVTPRIAVDSSIDRETGTCCIVIDDNGPGIDAEARDRIFQPFFTTKRSGTGLGLALVQKIVVFHNGRVLAGVSPLGGASLQVTLPIA